MGKAILFTKRGCTPCANLTKFILTETDLDYEEIDVEENPDIIDKYGIMSVPTLIIGDSRTTGFNPPEVMKLINDNK